MVETFSMATLLKYMTADFIKFKIVFTQFIQATFEKGKKYFKFEFENE